MILCPSCHSHKIVKNGKTHYGKQHHKCKNCNRQFVLNNKHTISEDRKEIARRLLLERLSLRAICRVLGVSMSWLMQFSVQTWLNAPEDLSIYPELRSKKSSLSLQLTGLQIGEMWSFVQDKRSKAWIWVAYEPTYRQIVAFHLGDRSKQSVQALWKKIPISMRKHCDINTDHWEAYGSIIPSDRHFRGKKYTYFIEGLFSKVRARVSRLVRRSTSFSQ